MTKKKNSNFYFKRINGPHNRTQGDPVMSVGQWTSLVFPEATKNTFFRSQNKLTCYTMRNPFTTSEKPEDLIKAFSPPKKVN